MTTTTPRKVPVWTPRDISSTNIDKFRVYIRHKIGKKLQTYADLHVWSIDPTENGAFWKHAYEFLEIGIPDSRDPGPFLERVFVSSIYIG
jgi:hypothetical protein